MPTQSLPLSRRDWLGRCGLGLGSLALAGLLADSERGSAANPMAVRQPHFAPKVKRVIHIFQEGAPSHLDTWDPKPALTKMAGKPIPTGMDGGTGVALASPFQFSKHGRAGIEISSVFPKLAERADDLCVIRSMQTDEPNHETAGLMMNCGEMRLARPAAGSWITYGLGSINQNLPGFVVLYHENQPFQGAVNWQSAFLPAAYQATAVDTKERRPERFIEHIRSSHASEAEQRLQLDLLRDMNKRHGQSRGDDGRLDARLESFELAYRMQTEATDAFDIRQEPQARCANCTATRRRAGKC